MNIENHAHLSCPIDERHGGPYDRGTADSWYKRDFNPHYYVAETGSSDCVELANMTVEEIIAYTIGFKENESAGNHKI